MTEETRSDIKTWVEDSSPAKAKAAPAPQVVTAGAVALEIVRWVLFLPAAVAAFAAAVVATRLFIWMCVPMAGWQMGEPPEAWDWNPPMGQMLQAGTAVWFFSCVGVVVAPRFRPVFASLLPMVPNVFLWGPLFAMGPDWNSGLSLAGGLVGATIFIAQTRGNE